MKILIGCDEASSADKLFYDLKRAGLPDGTQAYVLSVADVFIIPDYEVTKSKRDLDAAYLTHIDREISKAQKKADDLAKKLRSRFPSWHFNPRATGGSPAGPSGTLGWNGFSLAAFLRQSRPGRIVQWKFSGSQSY